MSLDYEAEPQIRNEESQQAKREANNRMVKYNDGEVDVL